MTSIGGALGPDPPRIPASAPPPRTDTAPPPSASDGQQFIDTLTAFSSVLAVKLYRLPLDRSPGVPILPCLDHEAMLHEGIAPHMAAYLQDRSGNLHEVVYLPDRRRIEIDAVSTMFERSEGALEELRETLRTRFPGCSIRVVGPSWIRGDLRVAKACRAQVALRDVLVGPDLDRTRAAVDRLQTISALMEKESRVASWSTRTVMTPLLAVLGFVSFQILSSLALPPQYAWVSSLRYVIVGLVGGWFLYYGLKAVQLTEMANRVWKRSAEYGLILSERRRLSRP
jgi:hypothetical protein